MPRTPSFALIVCSAAIAVAGTALLSGATAVSTVRQDPATASAPAVVEVTAYRFAFEPSVKSSLKFLRKTPWAREKVEGLYLFMLRERRRNTTRP